jgi:manganese/zinc/iron transport system ATP- binding protein
MKALAVSHLTVNYGKTPVLWDISLTVPKGKLVGIIGPNGAGKTTFLKACLGLHPNTGGKIEILGHPLGEQKKRIAYVPQREAVDWDFPITVEELVLMGRYGQMGLISRPRKADLIAVERTLEAVQMKEFAKRQIGQLSGGQQQRAFLARALMQDADVYFLDEPFAGIDIGSESMIISLLQKLRQEDKTLFVVHHDLNSVESYFDWLIVLNMRLVASGPLETSFTSHVLNAAYGKSYALFGEALKLSQNKKSGG